MNSITRRLFTLALATLGFWPLAIHADVVRYRAVVQAEASLLSFYPFDGDTGSIATDRQSPLQNGTLTGATFSSAAGTVGEQSVQGARVALGAVPDFEFADGSGTVEMFVYQTGTAAYNPCLFAGRDDSRSPAVRYSMHGDTAGTGLWIWNGATALRQATPVSMLNRLVHVVYVFNAGNLTVYFDGAPIVTWAIGLGGGTGRPFQIGASGPSNQEAWPGRIDEVAVYSDALSASVVAAHYSAFFFQSNSLLHETFNGITGRAVSNLTAAAAFPDSPSTTALSTNGFVMATNVAENFGRRLSGFVTAPQSGGYTFWIASADASELWLSPSEDPTARLQIARVTGAAAPFQWTAEPGQRSAVFPLSGGRRYYIEALMKAGTGADHLAVRWQWPDSTIEEPIPNARLQPFGFEPPAIAQQPADATVIEPNGVSFSVGVFRSPGTSFQWQRDGANIAGALASFYTLPATSAADSNATFRCLVANPFGSNVSATATLTVLPDTTPPAIQSVSTLGQNVVTITFSEALGPGATNLSNFSLGPGAGVLRAAFGLSANVIVLTTAVPLAPGSSYTLTLQGVADRYGNVLAAGTTAGFSASAYDPLSFQVIKPASEPIGPATRRGALVISEIMFHPTNRTDLRQLEFVEIYNSQLWEEDLSSYRLTGELDYTIPAGTTIPAGGYLVIAGVPADLTAVYGVANVTGGFTNRLNNAGGTLRLRDYAQAVVFEVEYDTQPPWPVAADGAGHSLVLARPSHGMNNPQAWASSSQLGGSPGGPEPVMPDPPTFPVVLNELLANSGAGLDFIEVFNYSTQTVELAGCFLSDDAGTNKFVIPPGTTIGPRGFVAFDESQLGFAFSAGGETAWLRDPSGRVLDALRFGGQQTDVSLGRAPDGSPLLSRLRSRTPAGPNSGSLPPAVVINEIMFNPITGSSDDEFVELLNRTSQPVDIGGWRLRGGVSFTIPVGRILPPGGYLVIAENAAHLIGRYGHLSSANTIGDFSGQLSDRGEELRLEALEISVVTNGAQRVTNTIHYVVSEVTYGSGGRWGRWTDGGGSSLELIDANGDTRWAANWAASDERAASAWKTIEFTGLVDLGQGTPDRFQILLQGEGECLVDDIEVVSATGGNRVANGDFEGGLTDWLLQGSHSTSTIEDSTGFNGSKCLHLRASSRGDPGANRVQKPLSAALPNGQPATLRAKVRWLAGPPEILLRVRGSWLEASGSMLTTAALGTPGLPNSTRVSNAGPAVTGVTHQPVLPAPGQPVTILAQVTDPDGVGSVAVRYRLDPSGQLTTANMTYRGAGWFSAEIPAQPVGRLVAFHVVALDGAGAVSTFPAQAPDRECLVLWGELSPGGLDNYRFWMTQATRTRWEMRERNSNEPLDVTFVHDATRVIYNASAAYSGSPFHTGGFNSPLGNACDYDLHFPDDDRLLGETDMNLVGPGTFGDDLTFQREQMLWWMARRLGGPALHRRFVRLFVNGQRRQTIFEDAQQPNGEFLREWFPDDDHGDLFKAQDWIEFGDDGATFLGGLQRAVLGRFVTSGGVLLPKRYRWMWAPRAVTGPVNDFSNLFSLVNTLAISDSPTYTSQVEALIDVESWSRALAVQRIVGNWDSWGWSYGKNMYAYKPARGRWAMVPWDLDFSYGTVGLAGGNPASDPPTADLFSNTSSFDGNSPGDPVATTFRNNPQFRRAYARALLDAANGPMSDVIVASRLNMIRSALQSRGFTPAAPDGIRSYIGTRRAYILGQLAPLLNAPLAITTSAGNDFSTNASAIRLTGTAPARIKTIVVNGRAYPVTWLNPTNWSLLLPLQAGLNALTVRGLDQWANPVPGLADTIAITFAGANVSPVDQVVINELHYNPVLPGPAFVELVNSGTNSFDLSGWRLDGIDFDFPPGSVITNRQFLVLANDRYAFGQAYGAAAVVAGAFNGRLDPGGEVLSLLQPREAGLEPLVVDRVRFEPVEPWPEAPNGSGASLQLIDPTVDNARVSNWSDAAGWRFFKFTGPLAEARLSLFFDSSGGDVYVDDLVLEAGAVAGTGANYLVNGGFESSLDPAWQHTDIATNSHRTNGLARSGSFSLHLVQLPGPSTFTLFYQDLPSDVVLNTTYTLSGWCLPSGRATNFTLRAGLAFQAKPNLRATSPTPGAANLSAAPLPAYPTLWLNEVVPFHDNGATDHLGDRDPWVELHNPGQNPVGLDGLFLSDTYADLPRWPFPADATIAPGGFLVVWCDGEPGEGTASEYHTNFRLGAGDGSVILSRRVEGAPQILDYLNYTAVPAQQSYGSVPDGQPFYRRTMFRPTPRARNEIGAAPITVLINEWMAANTSAGGLPDPADGDYDDWFELYNAGPQTVDLGGYFLTDNLTNKFQFQVPDNGHYRLPPDSHLLVWADGEPGQNTTNRADLHVSFNLRAAGEAIGLFAPDGTRIDAITFANQTDDISQGRNPDGSANIAFLTMPSPGSRNSATPPSPVVTAVEVAGNSVTLTFTTRPGARYRVQFNADLTAGHWEDLPGDLIATDAVSSKTDTPAGQQRFYRVQVVP